MTYEGSFSESELIAREKAEGGFEQLLDYIQEEYFENFLDQLDITKQKATLEKIKEKTGTDILSIIKSIDCNISVLVEKISELSTRPDVEVLVSNSFRDVLGSAIPMMFRTVLKVVKQYDTPEMQEKINDADSSVRKVLDSFSKENSDYYLNSLCNNDEILMLELTTSEGYLGTHAEFFLQYPCGSIKTTYFKFLSELEKGNVTKENIEEVLAPLDGEIVDKDAVRKSDLVK